MQPRKSTRILLAIFAGAAVLLLFDGSSNRLGAAAVLLRLAAIVAGIVLAWRALRWAFRLVVHRLTLRLAFSYFLIGIVPIPLLAALLFAVGYLLAHEFIATRLRSEVDTLAEVERVSGASIPRIRLGPDDRVVSSDVPWMTRGDSAAWAARLSHTRVVFHSPVAEGSAFGAGGLESLYAALAAAHADGARVHSNSWGLDGTTEYNQLARDIDLFSHDFEDSLVVFATTNMELLQTPENAKNVLAVVG